MTRLMLLRPPQAAVNGLARARRMLRGTRSRLGPSFVDVLDRTMLGLETRALGIAAELDIAELLADGPQTAHHLANRLTPPRDPDALERMLAMLAAGGMFKRGADGRWRNTASSKALRESHPMSVRNWARFFGGPAFYRVLAEADLALVPGGSAVAKVTGTDFYDWVNTQDPQTGALFNEAMVEGSRLLAESFARTVDLHDAASICDVGGGTGRLLEAVLDRHRHLRGVLFELPEVVPQAIAHERLDTHAGSFFDPDTVPKGCDRYVLVSVVHNWSDDDSTRILANVASAMTDASRALVVEQVLDPSAPPLFERHADFLMLLLTGGGRERSDADFRRLFAAAGLAVTRTWRLATQHAVYEVARDRAVTRT